MQEMNHLDLNLLRVFEAMWRHGHLGRAAEELGLSQPATSHALQRLRVQLNDPLFVKVRSGMQPSARAIALAPVVQGVLGQVRAHLLAERSFDPALARRVFTIAMSDLGEAHFLPRIVARLMKEAPGVDIRSVLPKPAQLTDLLERSQVDLAIGFFPDLQGADVFQQQLFRHGFVCLARKRHPVVRGRITAKQFAALSHAVVQTETRSQELVEQYLQRHGVVRRQLLRSTQFMSIPPVIASTDLIVTVPLPVGEMFAKLVDLQVLTPPFPIPALDLRQHWHRCQHDDPANRWLRGVTRELFGRAG